MKSTYRICALVFATALVLAACGTTDKEEAGRDGPSTTVADAQSVKTADTILTT